MITDNQLYSPKKKKKKTGKENTSGIPRDQT